MPPPASDSAGGQPAVRWSKATAIHRAGRVEESLHLSCRVTADPPGQTLRLVPLATPLDRPVRPAELDSDLSVSTVLIAAAANLAPLKQRGEYQDAMAFADTDALRALETIARQHPALVVLDSVFAATSRGTALINRIKADPTLSGCEVQIATFEPGATPQVPARAVVVEDVTIPPGAAPQPGAPLDVAGTRRSPRYEMIPGIEVLVDGNPATLVDLSTTGAQVMAMTSLKPNQRVRITLPGGLVPIRASGAITWAIFEMSDHGPRYRAGVDFHSPDQAGIQRFIQENRK